MFLTLWNYLRGYVIIEVSGFSVERFVNLAVHKGVYIWDVVPKGNCITMKVSVKGFKLLKSCAKKTKCHIKITGKTGCPFFLFKHRKRKLFAVGIIVFILALYSLSSFIWLIEIEGNDRIETFQILEFCKDNGFEVGSFKPKLNLKQLEKDLKNKFTELSWITIQVHGTRATIKMTETIPKLEMLDLTTPCDIVAKTDGLITSIVASTGTPKVKAKDVVEKGDILVSGELILKDGEIEISKEYVHSQAEVKAKLWHELNVSIPFNYITKKYTENIKNRYEIIVLEKKINLNLFNSTIPFQNYDKITTRKQLSAGKNFVLPIIIVKNEYKEYIPVKQKYSYEEAKTAADKLITKKIINDFDFETDIIDKKFEYSKTDKELKVKATISVIENIGIEQPIYENNNLKDEGSKIINGTTENTNTE